MAALKEPGLKTWKDFKVLLQQFSSPTVHGGANGHPSGPGFEQPETAWQLVLKDLAVACDLVPDDTACNLESELRPLVKGILQLLPDWSVLDPAPPLPADARSRREILRNDLLARESKYFHMLTEAFVPEKLKRSRYSPESVTDCLTVSPQATLRALFEDTRAGLAAVLTEPGRGGWQALLRWYEEHVPDEEMHRARADLYLAGTSEHRQFLLELYSNALGVLYSGASLGYLPAFPVIRDIQRRAYRKFAKTVLAP
jgi:hypothetical protein